MMNTPAAAHAIPIGTDKSLCNVVVRQLRRCIDAPPQTIDELCKTLGVSYKQLWQCAESELEIRPHDLLDFISALSLVRALALNPTQKIFRLMSQLSFQSESAFCTFCKRTFKALPSAVKQDPRTAFNALKKNYPALAPFVSEQDIFPDACPIATPTTRKTVPKKQRKKTEEKKRSRKQKKISAEKKQRKKQ
jgi:AraC-like DNA-binding protein